MALSLITVFMAFGWTGPLDYLNWYFNSLSNRWVVGICAVAAFIAGLVILFYQISARPPVGTHILGTEQGEVSISLTALETMVKKAAFQIHGVREVKPLIKIIPAGVAVLIKTALVPGTVVPEAAQEIQTGVKTFLEKMAGLNVVEVKVLVTEVAQENKGRLN